MISFDLKCSKDHVFEVWFRSSSDYEDQKTRGLLSCPTCGDLTITKAIMAPAVGRKSNQASVRKPAPDQSAPAGGATPPLPAATDAPLASPVAAKPKGGLGAGLPDAAKAELMQFMGKLRTEVEKSFDNVGDKFAEEARKIHYGDAEDRGIYGQADPQEVVELLDEGIDLLPLPDVRKSVQ